MTRALTWLCLLFASSVGYGSLKLAIIGSSVRQVAVVVPQEVEPIAGDDAVPETNRIDWAGITGVTGGSIPYRTTIASTLSSGATVAEINTAISSASTTSNRVVKLNAGSYTLSGNINLKSGVTLRGAGTNTVLILDNYITMGEAGFSRQNVDIASGFEKGSTEVVLSGAPPDLSVGSIMMITESNNTAFVHQYGYEIPKPDNFVLDGTHTSTYKSINFGDTFTDILWQGVALDARASAALVDANPGSYYLDSGADILWMRLPDDSDLSEPVVQIGIRLLCFTGHGAHPQWTLLEGNKVFKVHADSIHGSASSWTMLRNWIRGEETNRTTFGWGCINLDSWNYHMNVVGNVLGHPAMSGWNYQEDAVEDDSDTDKSIYAFNYSGYNEGYTYEGTNSLKTVLRHGNFDYATATTNWDAGIATRSITNSYYLTAKPSWFGSHAWPPIGHDTSGRYTNQLPAEARVLANTY